MPLWVSFALIGAALTAVVGIIDKMVLSKWMRDAVGSFFAFGVMELASGLVVFALIGAPLLRLPVALVALASGAAFGISSYFYFQGIKVGEITRLIPLYDLSPLFISVFAAVFLGEIFPPAKYAGVALLIVGALLLTVRKIRGHWFGPGTGWMLLAVASIASGAVVSKYLLGENDPWTVFAYAKFGSALSALPFMSKGYAAFRQAAARHGKPVVLFSLLSEGLTSATTVFFLFAAASGYVTLVSALIGTHPFFLLAFTAFLGIWRPGVLKEEFGHGLLLRKAAGIALLFLGGWLVT